MLSKKKYTTSSARIATIAAQRETRQPKSPFYEGQLVRLLYGIYCGREGRILSERTGYFEIAVYDAGFGAKTLLPAKWIQRA